MYGRIRGRGLGDGGGLGRRERWWNMASGRSPTMGGGVGHFPRARSGHGEEVWIVFGKMDLLEQLGWRVVYNKK